MIKPKLDIERMNGSGSCNGINYLYGLDELCTFLKIDKSKNILELGSNNGVSSSLFAYYANTVTCVDIIKTKSIEEVLKNYSNIIFKHGDICEVVPTLNNNYFDVIYIDADHNYESVKHDILISMSKLKKDGIISGHDYNLHGVSKAVNELFSNKKIITFSDKSWAVI